MKRFLLLLFCCVGFTSIAQQQTVSIKESRFKLGFNMGGAWQSSDVHSKAGSGVGITLEYCLLQNATSPLGISLRGRYLYSQTYGRDLKSSTNILNNDAVNGVNHPSVNYTGNPIYHNFKTEGNNLDLELMLHANRLRERKGIILYVFGGVGAMGYRSSLDQLGSFGEMYDYSTIGTSTVFNRKKELDFLRDGTYETSAQNNGRPHWVFAPSFGIGYGIRFSRVFSMILEHKVTLPETDLLDGQQWNSNNERTGACDIHHYANLGFRFGIGGGRGRGSVYTDGNTHIQNPPPVISIQEPSYFPATAPNCNAELIFRVANINAKENVEIRLNGRTLASSEYTMDVTTKQFRVNKKLEGESVFSIRAYNGYGEDNESVQFGCSPTVLPPNITLVEPGATVVSNCQAAFKVTVKNIQSKDQLEISMNGNVMSKTLYDFNSSSGLVTLSSVALINNTTFVVKATNSAGTASFQITFNCSNRPVNPAPEVRIISPTENPYISYKCTELVTAQLYNVKATDRIQVLLNNVALRPNQYTYAANTGILTFNVVIANQVNVAINVTTPGGTASAQLQLICRQETPPIHEPPTVSITLPAITPVISTSCNEQIIAYATNIKDKSGIKVFVNGTVLPPSQYTFNAQNGEVKLSIRIDRESLVRITATNTDGNASDEVLIRCQPAAPIQLPTVNITTPNTDPYLSISCNEQIIATTRNVAQKKDISIFINGLQLNSAEYTFDASLQKIQLSRKIVERASVQIVVSNAAGTASDQVEITCKPAVTANPTVQITTPTSTVSVNPNCTEHVVAKTSNVTAKEQITVSINNRFLPPQDFIFDVAAQQVEFNVVISNTTNVQITVSNGTVSATDQIALTCSPPVIVNPPTVSITTPASEKYTSVTCREKIVAQVSNVKNKSEVQVWVGTRLLLANEFTLSPDMKLVSLEAAPGNDGEVRIRVSNSAGAAEDKVVLNCVAPPTVVVTTPTSETFTSGSCREFITAAITNIETKPQISVTVNGQQLDASFFDFNPSTRVLSMNHVFSGTSVVKINAKNEAGNANDAVTLICKPVEIPKPIPVITLLYPVSDTVSKQTCKENCSFDIKAKIENVSDPTMCVISVNGKVIPTTQYTFTPSSGMLGMNRKLNAAANEIIVIEARNANGTAKKEVRIACNLSVGNAAVQITAPATAEVSSQACDQRIIAKVSNIAADKILVYGNGLQYSKDQYTWNESMQTISLNVQVKGSLAIKIEGSNACGSAADEVRFRCLPPLPLVTITDPAATPYTSVSCEESVKATVKNVTGKEQIVVKINGQALATEAYTYNPATSTLDLITKVEANTLVEIIATNESGSASDKVQMVCKPRPNPPTVTITTPPANPYTSVACQELVKATVMNVTEKAQIKVTINGQIISNEQVTFNAATHLVELNVKVEGNTALVISATNESGSASDNTVLICRPRVNPPTVSITTPSANPYTSVDCQETVKATVLNVTEKSQITVTINGQPVPVEQYSFTAATHVVELTTKVEANTSIEIVATNESGTASDKVMMNCRPRVNAPTVTITTPATTPYTSVSCQESVKATVMNVTGKSQIEVKANGQPIADDQYLYNATTHLVELTVRVATNTSIEIIATNETGTASDKVVMNCQPEVEIPPFPESNTCPATSPAKYVDCGSCHSSESGVNSLSVDAGKKVCIKGTFRGAITMNGGMLVICGTAEPSSLNFNSGTIVVNGEATFGSLNLNNSSCTVRNFGTLSIGGTTFNSRIENYGTMTISSDCNVNTNGVLKNTGELTIRGSVNNGNDICNSGTMNIAGSLHNNNGATFINSCKVIVANDFHNNSVFDNNAYVKSGKKTIINGGSTFKMGSGSRLVAASLDFNGTISGTSGQCAVVNVSGQTVVNGAAKLTGNATLCDANGIEQNNSGGAITSTCTCSIPASRCVPTDGVVENTEKKIRICHKPPGNPENSQSLDIPESALQAHLDHGDHIGDCTEDDKKKTEKKVRICHKPPGNPENCHTLEVGESAVQAHLNHGDHLGDCTEGDRIKKVEFEIKNGNVIPKECYNATITVLGCALKEGGVGIDYPVIAQAILGGNAVDPFGTYAGYNKASDVNDHKTHVWRSSQALVANTAITIKAKSINPKTSALLYERVSSSNDPFVKVLRNGDPVPNVPGMSGQEDAEAYMKEYILDGKMSLGSNQAIFLFELGTGSTTSKSYDLQDCVILVTLSEASTTECNSNNSQKEKEEAERKAREEAEKKAREEAEKKTREDAAKKAQEDAAKRAQEDAAKKAQEDAAKRAQEDAAKKAQEDAAKKNQEDAAKKAQEEAERKAREEAEKKAHEDAAKKAQEDAERKAREEAEKKAHEEAAKKAHEDAARKAQEDAEKKAREEAEKQQRENVEKQQREEAERKQREEAEKHQREEAERKQREEAERHQREEAERKQREEAAKHQREEAERKQREEAEKHQREEAERKQREEAEKHQREEAERKAREEAERLEREKKEKEDAEKKDGN